MEYGAKFNGISGTIAHLIFLKTWFIEMPTKFLIRFYIGHPSQPNSALSQPAFTCSKLSIETEQGGIFSKLTIKTQERHQWRSSDVFIINCEHISHLVLVFLLLTLSM